MSDAMKRREFIGAGLSAAIALQMDSAPRAQSAEPARIQKVDTEIGLILYTIRDALKTPEDIAKSLERVKQIGYDAVELAGVGPIENKRLADLLKQNELKAISAHASWEGMLHEPEKVMEQYKELGCNHLVVSSIPDEYRNQEGYEVFAKKASEVAQRLAENGFTWGYHNHSFEFTHFGGRTGQQILVEESDPKFFQFEIDTYWVQHGGADPSAWIDKVKGRVPTVHMKDMDIVQGKQVFAEVGEGNMNWPEILKACKDAGVVYYIVEQDVCLRDPFESIAMSLKNMKSWGLS